MYIYTKFIPTHSFVANTNLTNFSRRWQASKLEASTLAD